MILVIKMENWYFLLDEIIVFVICEEPFAVVEMSNQVGD